MVSRLRPDERRAMFERVIADMVELMHHVAPAEFDEYLRERRMLVQAVQLGTCRLPDNNYLRVLEASEEFVANTIRGMQLGLPRIRPVS